MKQKITLKLFLITVSSFIVLVGIVITVQLFIVSRLYLTTEYTKERESTLLSECSKMYGEYGAAFFANYSDTDAPLRILNRYAAANSACFFVLDKNYAVKYASDNTKTLDRVYIRSIQKTFRSGREFASSNNSFRVGGLFNIPSRYIAVFQTVKITPIVGTARPHAPSYNGSSQSAGLNNMEVSTIVAVTKEVYTGQNYAVLQKYIAYLFIFAVLLAVALAAVFSVVVTRPILRIRNTAAQMTKLDFKQKCDYHADDEIGELAQSLNFLSDKLSDTIRQLQDANGKLTNDLDMQRELDRMRKEFIAAVSHEFKTPLTLIKGFTESIRENKVKDEELPEAEAIIVEEVDKMDTLVQAMLDLSRLESISYELDRKVFDCTRLLENIAEKYAIVMQERRIRFSCSLVSCPVPVFADEFRIEQVVTNFLNNAILHTPENGMLTLRSHVENDRVIVCVENEGDPIAESELSKIWDRFYRTDKSRSKKSGGTGLGLSICKAILEKHGCAFGAENMENGVRFYFTLEVLK